MDEQRRNIVIVGGGVMGCATAYYLTRHPKFNPALHTITILEAGQSVAAGASGKAGGLLGLWAYPACLVPLSYRLHAELAAEHDGFNRWGYRRLKCGSLVASVSKQKLEKLQRARASQENGALGDDINNTNNINNHDDDHGKHEDEKEEQAKDWEKLPKQDEEAKRLLEESNVPVDLYWVDRDVVRGWSQMGRPGATETAQVHPYHFTTSLAQLAQERGALLITQAKVTKMVTTETGVEAVEYLDRATGEGKTIAGVTDVVVSAGPWTGRVLPRTRVEGLRAHSVVYKADISPYAVFTDIDLPSDFVPEHRARLGQKRPHKGRVDPEIYARPFGEVYACGEPDPTLPLPETVDEVQADEAQCNDMISYIATISSVLGSSPVKAKQACYLPQHIRFGKEHDPLVGPTTVPGLWVASGHTCWGIQNSPGTGKLMAEYVFDGEARSANIEKLDPRKFKVG